jgi:hypothetical protein
MRIIIIPAILLTVCWGMLTGCYKDKGNYQYHDLNNITTNLSDTTISIFQLDTLRIHPEVKQSIPDKEGLEYEWVMYADILTPLTRRTLSNTRNLDALIVEGPGPYVLNLYIRDKSTGVTTIVEQHIKVVSALNEGWLVLEDGSPQADISIITPVDAVFHHIYSKINPEIPLPQGTHHLYVFERRNSQIIYILSPAGGTQVDYSTFMTIGKFKDWFYVAPEAKPQLYMPFDGGEVLLNDGRPFCMSLYVPPPYKLSLAPAGHYYMAPFDLKSMYGPVLYDTISQRFIAQDAFTFDLINFSNGEVTDAFNMNNIGKHMQYAENGPGYDQSYAFFKNNNNDSMFVYTFTNSGPYSTPGTAAPIGTAPGIKDAGIFRMSKLLPHLYYASNNKIYLYDIPAAAARVTYSFPAGTVIRSMKTTDDNNQLIVATYENTAGKVYYFNISATGDFERNNYSKVFGGFGLINDLAYKNAP